MFLFMYKHIETRGAHRGKNRVPDLGFYQRYYLWFYPIDLGICSIKCFTVDLGTLNTFDGTEPKVDSVKPKVRKRDFFPCVEKADRSF